MLERLAKSRITHAAAERNKLPILSYFQQQPHILKNDRNCFVLEVASGTGQHAAYFHRVYPLVYWQTTEYNRDLFPSIQSWIQGTSLPDPIYLDASHSFLDQVGSFHKHYFDVVFNCNMVHISPKECSIGLIKGAAQVLKQGGHLVVYGPFKVNNECTTESNRQFDEQLKSKHSDYGLRDVDWLNDLAVECGFGQVVKVDMPSNNFMLSWCKL